MAPARPWALVLLAIFSNIAPDFKNNLVKLSYVPKYFYSLLLVGFLGCQTEVTTPVGNTTVAQDKDFIHASVMNSIPCIQSVKDGNLAQAVIQFLGASNGVNANQTWVDQMTGSLDTAMGILELDDNTSKFNYSNYWGTYTWNPATTKFVKRLPIISQSFSHRSLHKLQMTWC